LRCRFQKGLTDLDLYAVWNNGRVVTIMPDGTMHEGTIMEVGWRREPAYSTNAESAQVERRRLESLAAKKATAQAASTGSLSAKLKAKGLSVVDGKIVE